MNKKFPSFLPNSSFTLRADLPKIKELLYPPVIPGKAGIQ